jgi:rootletin
LILAYFMQVEREKMKHEEFLSKSMNERTSIDRTMTRLEEDNIEMQRQIQMLQAGLAQAEQDHSQRSENTWSREQS